MDISTAENCLTPQTVLSDRSLFDTTFDDEEDKNQENMTDHGGFYMPPSSSRQLPNTESFDRWECIPKASHIELCKLPSDLQDDGASIR
jgi:hypothetical protein